MQPPSDAPRLGSNPNFSGPFTRYSVDFAISPHDLKLDATSNGAHHGNIEIALIAYDREGKRLNSVVIDGDINLQIHKEINVPKEYVYLRTGVYDLKSGTAGTLGVPLNDTIAPTHK